MSVLKNIGCLLTCAGNGQAAVGAIEHAAVVWEDGVIKWVGEEADLPSIYQAHNEMDAGRRLVVPGLVDCHTHLAFGGWRHDEFKMRAQGKSYLEIAKAGGGIVNTVEATRKASKAELVDKAMLMLEEIVRLGVTTIECKSGYGLTLKDELKLLEVYHELSAVQPVRIVSTLLAAHIIPSEYRHDRAGYIQLVCEEIIPAAASLARFCDVFVEEGAFTVDEARLILQAGLDHGLKPKLHVDQLTDGGGASLAAEVGAASADHLEYAADEGIEAMARAGVVAVSLPFATFNLRQPAMPARRFIEAGVPVAVATDYNPGSAPSYHLPFAMYLGCILQHMTPDEVLKGATLYAASAIGVEAQAGSIEVGKHADLIIVEAHDTNSWIGHTRANAVVRTIIGGEVR